jgi:hypothetical protein
MSDVKADFVLIGKIGNLTGEDLHPGLYTFIIIFE